MDRRPLYVRESKAAKLMDMNLMQFRNLVEAGALPSPVIFHGLPRWRVDDLAKIVSGTLMDQDFET